MGESLGEKTARARRGEKVKGGTEVSSAEYEDTLAGEARAGGTTAGRMRMKSPEKTEEGEPESVLAKIARKKREEADAAEEAARKAARAAGQKTGLKAVK